MSWKKKNPTFFLIQKLGETYQPLTEKNLEFLVILFPPPPPKSIPDGKGGIRKMKRSLGSFGFLEKYGNDDRPHFPGFLRTVELKLGRERT